MREIEFRGLRKDGKGWEYGDLIRDFPYHATGHSIQQHGVLIYEVIPESIGQYTGLKDKNGVKIFEGDVVAVLNKPYDVKKSIVVWGVKSHRWSLKCEVIKDSKHDPAIKYYGLGNSSNIEVVGSIHEGGLK